MKKLIFILLCVLGAMSLKAEDVKQIEFVKFEETKVDANNLIRQMIMDWPKAATNNRKDAALVRVKVENMPVAELKNIVWKVSEHSFVNPDYSRVDERQEIWLWVDPAKDMYLDATYNGSTDRKNINELKPKDIYEVTMRNNKTVSVVVSTLPQGALVEFENGIKATTPEQLNNVSLGKHVLRISLNGRHMITDTIMVTETNTKFPEKQPFYDLRDKKLVDFKTTPSGAKLYEVKVDGNNDYMGIAPITLNLSYGPHTIMAVHEADTTMLPINVSFDSPKEYTLEPVPEQTFDVQAYQSGVKINGDLYVRDDNGLYRSYKDYDKYKVDRVGNGYYKLRFPVGKELKMRMSYSGNHKERSIKVKRNMSAVEKFNIPVRNKTFVWPWQKDFRSAFGGFSFGYVQKQYVTKDGNYYVKENIWGDEGASLHGGQIGMHFEPAFKWGLGLYTGLFYEFYLSPDGSILDDDTFTYVEHDLCIPLHLYYRLRLGERCHVAVHGGIGMDFIISHNVHTGSEEAGTYVEYDSEDLADVGGFPKRFNLSGEFGVDFRWRMLGASFTYSRGLTNQGFYSSQGDYKTYTNKLSFSISIMFESGEY